MQEVSADLRTRRAKREQQALEAELLDLASALERAQRELAVAIEAERQASDQRIALAKELQDTRVSRMAPFMARLEDVSQDIGRMEQQVAALPAIAQILERRERSQAAVEFAAAEVERLRALVEADASVASRASHACSTFSERMNEFLNAFEGQGWVDGLVTISSEDLTFYVGTRPWSENLGAEARVIFFFAYCYALLHLSGDLPEMANAPGLLLLDNPYQQGLPPIVVQAAINLLGRAAETQGTQIVLTQARPATGISARHTELVMRTEYAG